MRESPHERLLERPKDQGAQRPGAWDAQEGGGEHLRGLAGDPQAPPRGGGHSAQAFAGTDPAGPRHPGAATRPVGAARRKRRRHACAPLRALWENETGVAVSVATMSRAVRRGSVGPSKKGGGGHRTRRAGQGFLQGTPKRDRSRAAEVRRRVLDQRSAHPALREGAHRREGFWEGAEELGQERHAHLLDHHEGDGAIDEHPQGSSDTESFGLYMREVLAPSLRAGQIVLMDNLSVHKGKWVRDLLEQKGCRLWLLPSYSPDLNPIEGAFSKVKNLISGRRRPGRLRRCLRSPLGRLRRSARRTPEASSRIAATTRLGTTHYENCSRSAVRVRSSALLELLPAFR